MKAPAAPRRRPTLSVRAAMAATRVVPAGALARRAAGGNCLLPYYHVIGDTWLPHISPLYSFRTVAGFHADLDFLLRFFRPIGLAEFLAAATGGVPARPDAMLLTFDDGFREIHDLIAPILRAKGVPAVFFLTSATLDNHSLCAHQKIALIVDRISRGVSTAARAELARRLPGHPANPAAAVLALGHGDGALLDQLAQVCEVDFARFLAEQKPYLTKPQALALLRDGFEIGAHSIDHPRYSDLSMAEQLRQTTESMDFLHAELGLRRRVFAFPHSDSGVPTQFFTQLSARSAIEATFGTSAPWHDSLPRNFQRFSMEKDGVSAAASLAGQAIRRAKHRLVNSPPLRTDGSYPEFSPEPRSPKTNV